MQLYAQLGTSSIYRQLHVPIDISYICRKYDNTINRNYELSLTSVISCLNTSGCSFKIWKHTNIEIVTNTFNNEIWLSSNKQWVIVIKKTAQFVQGCFCTKFIMNTSIVLVGRLIFVAPFGLKCDVDWLHEHDIPQQVKPCKLIEGHLQTIVLLSVDKNQWLVYYFQISRVFLIENICLKFMTELEMHTLSSFEWIIKYFNNCKKEQRKDWLHV